MNKTMQTWRNIDIEGYEKNLFLSPHGDKISLILKETEKYSAFYKKYTNNTVGTIIIHFYRNEDPVTFAFQGDMCTVECKTVGELFDTEELFNKILNKLKEFKMLPYQQILNIQNSYYQPHHEIYFIRNNRYDVNIGVEYDAGKYNMVIDYNMCKFITSEEDLSKVINIMIFKIEHFIKSINKVLELQGLK